jgi:hypothetical protein
MVHRLVDTTTTTAFVHEAREDVSEPPTRQPGEKKGRR